MSNLRDLSLISPVAFKSYLPRQLAIMGGREGVGVTSGNACCCWIVPSGVTWATFEMYGSGGDGPGACCCAGPGQSASNGIYSVKTVSTTGNAYFNICVGMSGCCTQSMIGTCGFPSYVMNAAGTVIGCAAGGMGGCALCGHMGGQSCNGNCCGSKMNGCNGLGDMLYPTISQPNPQHNYCTNHSFPFLPGTYQYAPNTRHGLDSCAVGMTSMGCCYWAASPSGVTTWPGGAGGGGQACGGACCWGSWGTPGFVLITYG